MKLSDIGEFGFLAYLEKQLKPRVKSNVVGVGDDAAVLDLGGRGYVLLSSDTVVEDVHFDLKYTSFFDLGWKAAASALSDIGAMGGAATGILINLGIAGDIKLEDIERFYEGVQRVLHDAQGVDILGGDTCQAAKFFVSITVIGQVAKKALLRRSGAKVGDKIVVLGTVGEAALGLELLKKQSDKSVLATDKQHQELMKKHLRPQPMLKEGRLIGELGLATAAIDNSDGLARSILEIARMSQVGAKIMQEAIPISAAAAVVTKELNMNLMDVALNGGEDYNLICTVSPKKLPQMLKTFKKRSTVIGEITAQAVYMETAKGKKVTLEHGGFDHFRRQGFWESIRKDWLKNS